VGRNPPTRQEYIRRTSSNGFVWISFVQFLATNAPIRMTTLLGPAIEENPGVAWVVEKPKRPRMEKRLPNDLAFVHAPVDRARKRGPLLTKRLYGGRGGSDPSNFSVEPFAVLGQPIRMRVS